MLRYTATPFWGYTQCMSDANWAPAPPPRPSRRVFARWSALLGAGATLPFYNEAVLAQRSALGELPSGAIRLNANENPMGPCPEALEAIYGKGRDGGRYYFELGSQVARLIAEQEGLPRSCVQAFAGSSDPLHRTVLAFCSKDRPFVTAEPGYEAGTGAAEFLGAPVFAVPLTKTWAHDVRAMAKAHPKSGVFYVCNPNNPTGTATPRADIEWLLANKPSGSIVLLDEAYIQISNEQSCADLVAAGKDLVILRTFSKIYGMAGIRAGAAMARPDLMERLLGFGVGMLPTTGMSAALASLQVKNLVPERRKIIAGIRDDVSSWLTAKRIDFIPSVSNKIMIDVKRPGREVFNAMAARGIFIGRSWPALPTHVRVTIGTREEMEKFKQAFAEVMA